MLGKLVRGKGAVSRPKVLFLSYFEKEPLIQLTQLDTLRDWPKLEGLSRVMVKKTSWWRIGGYKRGQPWSNKARYYSREASADGCLRARVSITEEEKDRFLFVP